MSEKPPSFGEYWLRGWRVIFLFIVVQLVGWLCSMLRELLPESTHRMATLLFAIILGPPISYWAFTLFYPDYEPRPEPANDAEASTCAACGSVIPPGTDACPNCGWTYKAA